MDNPRPEKVAVVEEVKERLSAADATVLTDYRGIDVPGMAELRRSLRAAGGDVKIYKNTLVRFAAQELGLEIDDLLVGPTALAFVEPGEDGTGDPVMVAKALRDFAKTNANLEIKGGVLGDRLLTAEEVDQLAKIAPRDELLARLAGGLAAPMRQMAGLLQALPRNFAYGVAALIDERGGPEAAAAESAPTEAAEPEAEAPEADAADEGTEAEATDTGDEAVADDPAEAADTGDAAEATDEDAEASAPADDSDSTDEGATEDTASDSSETDDSDSEES